MGIHRQCVYKDVIIRDLIRGIEKVSRSMDKADLLVALHGVKNSINVDLNIVDRDKELI